MITITIPVEETDKQRFEAICSADGLDSSTVISLFIKSVLREKRFPFDLPASIPSPVAIGGMTRDQLDAELQKESTL